MASRKLILVIVLVLALVFLSGCLQSYREPNPQLCEKVAQQQNRDSCYLNAAFAKGDEALCMKIIDLNQRDQCYTNLAVGNMAPSFD